MKLLQLTSDNLNFKTLNFTPTLNIVAGLQLTEEEKKTINSIGKSLTLTLVQLMFGAKLDTKNPKEKKLKDFLSTYGIFYLYFNHSGKDYEIKKDFSNPKFYINDVEIAQKNYTEELNKIFFEDNSDLSFRHVFNSFSRRFGGDYYSNPIRQQGMPLTDYPQRLNNLKLLHIDTVLVEENFKIKDQISKLENAQKFIKEYQDALDKVNLKDLKDEYIQLIEDKKSFVIAQNYDTIKVEADELTEQLNDIRNAIQKGKNSLQKKQQNLLASENIDINPNEITNLYKEAEFFFDDKVVKRLNDAQKFHNTLIGNRKNRIQIEIKELTLEQDELTKKHDFVSENRDAKLALLDTTGALEEYHAIEEKIKNLYQEIEKLTKYQKLLSEFSIEKSELDVKSTTVKQKSILYLEKEKEYLENIEDEFRFIVKKFYDHHGGSLKIKEAKQAKYLYDIFIDIDGDGGQSVGNVGIFCYDVLLYKMNKSILNFLAHDGFIFSEMDGRQKAMIFKVIIELIKKYDLQYFINIGDNSFKEILQQTILTDEEKEFIQKHIILELYDKEPEYRFFGEAFG
ncbi:MAG: Unknown protein [uncultured Sulfurovum sp.]|uniref:DUF2326 domain-containing protein n=1 Tax=uncultured Sulfurovum sp. TaxID=269237 RepID=A0A6S6SZH8_9BACT|nr:MAG: Unknown protein [uncultured Sulfurovum sp.]